MASKLVSVFMKYLDFQKRKKVPPPISRMCGTSLSNLFPVTSVILHRKKCFSWLWDINFVSPFYKGLNCDCNMCFAVALFTIYLYYLLLLRNCTFSNIVYKYGDLYLSPPGYFPSAFPNYIVYVIYLILIKPMYLDWYLCL